MPAKLLNAQTKQEFVERINKLKPDTPRKFGKLTPHELLSHLSAAIKMSLDELNLTDDGNIFTRSFGKWLVVYVPWPKGKIVVTPKLTPPPAAEFEADRAEAIRQLGRFIEVLEKEPERSAQSPLFGRPKMPWWSKMHAKHFDHHFQQFGV